MVNPAQAPKLSLEHHHQIVLREAVIANNQDPSLQAIESYKEIHQREAVIAEQITQLLREQKALQQELTRGRVLLSAYGITPEDITIQPHKEEGFSPTIVDGEAS